MSLAPYRIMWAFVLFDLPVTTKEARRNYTRFRSALLKLGMSRIQFSVYVKPLPSEEAGEALAAHVHSAIPPQGEVRILRVTDRQFGKMEVYSNRKAIPVEDIPDQIALF